jgi:hypothetical protein
MVLFSCPVQCRAVLLPRRRNVKREQADGIHNESESTSATWHETESHGLKNLAEKFHLKLQKQGRKIGVPLVAGLVQQARQGKGRSRGVAKEAVEARTWCVHRARAQALSLGREMLCRKG